MAEKGRLKKDRGELPRHHANLLAERHVQLTGHAVEVPLHLDLRDDKWIEKLTPERRPTLDEFCDRDVTLALAQYLLSTNLWLLENKHSPGSHNAPLGRVGVPSKVNI